MGVEIIQNQHNPFRFWIHFLRQPAQMFAKVFAGAPLRDAYTAPAAQRFNREKKIGGAAPFLLIVLTKRLFSCHRQAAAQCIMQFFADFIYIHHRTTDLIRPSVDI